MERQVHEQQQLRGNQQMMNGVDYSGLNSGGGGGDSYQFDLPNGGMLHDGSAVVSTYDGVTTILSSASDPLTFMQPSIVRDEILSGTVPTIIHRQPMLDESGDMHEMQTLIGVGGGMTEMDLINGGGRGSVQVVPNMTMSEETISMPSDSGSGRGSSLEGGQDLSSVENLNGLVVTSTPTKNGNGIGMRGGMQDEVEVEDQRREGIDLIQSPRMTSQLPIVELYGMRSQSPISFLNNNNNNNHNKNLNNNNPKLVNKNNVFAVVNGGNMPTVQRQLDRGEEGPAPAKVGVVYSTVNKKGVHGTGRGGSIRRVLNGGDQEEMAGEGLESGEQDNLIRRDGRLVHENGYEDDDSRLGLLLNGSGVSGVSAENGEAMVVSSSGPPGRDRGSSIASKPMWDTFRRPIVGPNG